MNKQNKLITDKIKKSFRTEVLLEKRLVVESVKPKFLGIVDKDLETSLGEYGFAAFDAGSDYMFIYGIKGDGSSGYTAFDVSYIQKNIKLEDEFDWVDWDEINEFTGEDVKTEDIPVAIFDMYNYYGYNEIFGESYGNSWELDYILEKYGQEDEYISWTKDYINELLDLIGQDDIIYKTSTSGKSVGDFGVVNFGISKESSSILYLTFIDSKSQVSNIVRNLDRELGNPYEFKLDSKLPYTIIVKIM
jgi:hypothetical protein